MRVCLTCGVEKPLDAFYRHKPSLRGRVRTCKACYRLRERARYADPAVAEAKKVAVKRYQSANREKYRNFSRINVTTYHMRRKQQFLENVDHRIVYQMHGGRCGICGQFVEEDEFQVDHVTPVSKGGLHGYINVQPAHPVCNMRKGARTNFTIL